MTERKENRKKTVATPSDAPRVSTSVVGDALRERREARGLSLEDVSASINIRTAQLRAIEDGNLEALPGMIYALGFVRSYAKFLKLNSMDIADQFKAEHGGGKPVRQPLHFPEPLSESTQPNMLIIGIAALCLVIVLGLWTIFRGSDDDAAVVAEQIPTAPVVETVTGLSAVPATTAAPVSNVFTPAPAAVTPAASVEPAAVITEKAPEVATPVVAEVKPVTEEKAAVVAEPEKPAIVAETPATDVINIKKEKSRVVITARQQSWIEVKDGSKTLVKKLLKPGEKYAVPAGNNLKLLTSNAGGLDIAVDGSAVAPLGKQGQIVKGVDLDANALKKVKTAPKSFNQ